MKAGQAMIEDVELSFGKSELWRQQCARNMMDCYGLGMQALMEVPGDKNLEALTRLMVEGMTAVRSAEDEKAFYRMAAGLCRMCARGGWEKGPMFRIYAAVFEDLGGSDERRGGKT